MYKGLIIHRVVKAKEENDTMPKVSVVMPAYNAEKYIGDAIDSILSQTFIDFEFIIIDDGSTDHTKDIILSYDDPRIIFLENKKNSGIVITLNKGIQFARGTYIARMDSDDIAISNRLEQQVNFLDNYKNIGVVGTALRVFGEGIDNQDRFFPENSEQLKAGLLFNSCLAHPTVMFRHSLIQNASECYDGQFSGIEDFALWWKLAQITDFGCINEVLLLYRSHKNQITKDKSQARIDRSFRFLNHRLQTLQIRVDEEEKETLIMYGYGKWEYFNSKTLLLFIKVLERIYTNNITKKFFNQSALKDVIGSAVVSSTNKANIRRLKKNKLLIYAVTKGILSPVLMCKSIIRNFI